MILAPVVRGRKGEYRKELRRPCARRASCACASTARCASWPRTSTSTSNRKHTIELVVDRLVIKARHQAAPDRLAWSSPCARPTAWSRLVIVDGDEQPLLANASPASIAASATRSSTPRMFSFNSPHGACPACDGLGARAWSSTRTAWCPIRRRVLVEGAIKPWARALSSSYYSSSSRALAEHYKHRLEHAVARSCPRRLRDTCLVRQRRRP